MINPPISAKEGEVTLPLSPAAPEKHEAQALPDTDEEDEPSIDDC